jgi:mannose/fructose-specific phosphotransferase system component IIA
MDGETMIMKKILLAAHGYFAQGVRSAMEIITDDVSSVLTINAYTLECQNPEDEIKKILALYDEDDLLVMTDLNFGSINQMFMRRMLERNIKLVTGVNLPLVVELAGSIGHDLSDEDIRMAVVTCREEMRFITQEEVANYGAKSALDDDNAEQL